MSMYTISDVDTDVSFRYDIDEEQAFLNYFHNVMKKRPEKAKLVIEDKHYHEQVYKIKYQGRVLLVIQISEEDENTHKLHLKHEVVVYPEVILSLRTGYAGCVDSDRSFMNGFTFKALLKCYPKYKIVSGKTLRKVSNIILRECHEEVLDSFLII